MSRLCLLFHCATPVIESVCCTESIDLGRSAGHPAITLCGRALAPAWATVAVTAIQRGRVERGYRPLLLVTRPAGCAIAQFSRWTSATEVGVLDRRNDRRRFRYHRTHHFARNAIHRHKALAAMPSVAGNIMWCAKGPTGCRARTGCAGAAARCSGSAPVLPGPTSPGRPGR